MGRVRSAIVGSVLGLGLFASCENGVMQPWQDFLVEGELLVAENPQKYLGKYVRFSQTKEHYIKPYDQFYDVGITTSRRRVTLCDSGNLAHFLNFFGMDFSLVQDSLVAQAMCDTAKVSIAKSCFLRPNEEWATYLSRNFGTSEDSHPLNGKIYIWNQLRLPLPWLYFRSSGRLEGVFTYKDGEFIQEKLWRN